MNPTPITTQRVRGLLDAAGINYQQWNYYGETTHLYFLGWIHDWKRRVEAVPGLCVVGTQRVVIKGQQYLMVAVKVRG